MEDQSNVVFSKTNPWYKLKCATVCCRDATGSYFVAKFRGEVFPRFLTDAVKRHNSMRNCLFGLPGRIYVNNPLDVKENDDQALDFVSHLYRLFRSALNRARHSNASIRLIISAPNACVIITSFPKFTQNLMHTRCRIHHKITSYTTLNKRT
jgi:hypothetical protein